MLNINKPPSAENGPNDYDASRAEFFSREGGIGDEASQEQAREWGYKVLDTLPYASQEERNHACGRLKTMLNEDYRAWVIDRKRNVYYQETAVIHDYVKPGENPSPLDLAERFVQAEKERLEKTSE